MENSVRLPKITQSREDDFRALLIKGLLNRRGRGTTNDTIPQGYKELSHYDL